MSGGKFFGKKIFNYRAVVIKTFDSMPLKISFVSNPEMLVKTIDAKFGEAYRTQELKKII